MYVSPKHKNQIAVTYYVHNILLTADVAGDFVYAAQLSKLNYSVSDRWLYYTQGVFLEFMRTLSFQSLRYQKYMVFICAKFVSQ